MDHDNTDETSDSGGEEEEEEAMQNTEEVEFSSDVEDKADEENEAGGAGDIARQTKRKRSLDIPEAEASTSTGVTKKARRTATQHIMVKTNRRGYNTYPAYLFEAPPLKLGIESLWRQFLIAKIESAKKQTAFYQAGISFMGFTKESIRTYMESQLGNVPNENQEKKGNEHAYAMPHEANILNDNQNNNSHNHQ